MNNPLDLIEQGCFLCLRSMLRASSTVTGCLEIRDGVYVLADQATAYHPLEAALVGEPAKSDDWQADVATLLGVTAEWIEGFLDGFAQTAEKSYAQDYTQGVLAAEELRGRPPGIFGDCHHRPTSTNSEPKTWLESLQILDPFSRGMCVIEAVFTHFVGPIPDQLDCLRGGLADLGLENLQPPRKPQNNILLAFVGYGVRVPGTPYRLRSWGVVSFVEFADGSEEATLPVDWKQRLLVVAVDHDGYHWIGKRVPEELISHVVFSHYRHVGDGWVPKAVPD